MFDITDTSDTSVSAGVQNLVGSISMFFEDIAKPVLNGGGPQS